MHQLLGLLAAFSSQSCQFVFSPFSPLFQSGEKNHIFCHISRSTNPIGLKFCVSVGFGHRLPHTKFQPLRLKDAEDIGWCSWQGNGTFDSDTSVVYQKQWFNKICLYINIAGRKTFLRRKRDYFFLLNRVLSDYVGSGGGSSLPLANVYYMMYGGDIGGGRAWRAQVCGLRHMRIARSGYRTDIIAAKVNKYNPF